MKIIETHFENKEAVQKAYMPFIKNGGLLIPTNEEFEIDEPVEIGVQLPGDPEIFRFKSKVVWISPANMSTQATGVQVKGPGAASSPVFGFSADLSTDNASIGVGVQLAETVGIEIHKRIQEML